MAPLVFGHSVIETLPRPRDDRVRLREIPARRMAVVRFSGFAGEVMVPLD